MRAFNEVTAISNFALNMGQYQRLSPMTAYYLRKLLEVNQDRLMWKHPDLMGSINLDNILKQVGGSFSVSTDVLDRLVLIHQSLSTNPRTGTAQIQDIEFRIFDGLGLKKAGDFASSSPSKWEITLTTGKDLVNQFNILRQKSVHLLGPKITYQYLLATRPDNDWYQVFKFTENSPISFGGEPLEPLSEEQLTLYLAWAHAFADKCSLIISDFDDESSASDQSLFTNTPWNN